MERTTFAAIKRCLPLVMIGLAILIIWYFRLYHYISFQTMAERHQQLQAWTRDYYSLSVLTYMLIYALSVALSLPGAAFLTILGGYLFGPLLGPAYVIISATLGAGGIFIIVKTALGRWLAEKAGPWANKLQTGFQENAFFYLLSLRLIPVVPFWVLNIVPALLNVPFKTFVLSTFIGIMPGSIVYATLGNGLGQLLAQGEQPNMRIILEPPLLLPLLGLALLSLLPIIYKHVKRS